MIAPLAQQMGCVVLWRPATFVCGAVHIHSDICSVLRSEIIRGIMGPVYLMALFATAVCVYEYALDAGTLPANFPDIAIDLDISGPFGLSTFALSLLLAYRTNASYGRFDEARKFWGGVVNRSRDLMRQVCDENVWLHMHGYIHSAQCAHHTHVHTQIHKHTQISK